MAECKETVIHYLKQVGFDTSSRMLNKKASELSGGQKQKAAIARALSMEPLVLLADEISSMLDDSAKDKNLLNSDSTVLDIGCGTGRHLLEFSKYTAHITGTDISSKMLAYAKEKLQHISGAQLIHGHWMEIFTKEKVYDLVFACMTPAITTIEHIKRMNVISRKYCMIERYVYEKDSVQQKIEKILRKKIFNLQHNDKNYVYGIWNILWHLGYVPQVFLHKQVCNRTQPLEVYVNEVERAGGTVKEIMPLLAADAKEDTISSEQRIIKAILLWEAADNETA